MLYTIICIFLYIILTTSAETVKPPFWQKAATARWLAHSNLWGVLSTTSVHLNGQAWGQPKSFSDGNSTYSSGNLYFYDSELDTSMQDIAVNPLVAFSVTMAELDLCTSAAAVGTGQARSELDPEDPRCARATFSGRFLLVSDPIELATAKAYLFDRHPAMATWPDDHDWTVHKIDIAEIWLIDIYGGATIVPVTDYFAVPSSEVADGRTD